MKYDQAHLSIYINNYWQYGLYCCFQMSGLSCVVCLEILLVGTTLSLRWRVCFFSPFFSFFLFFPSMPKHITFRSEMHCDQQREAARRKTLCPPWLLKTETETKSEKQKTTICLSRWGEKANRRWHVPVKMFVCTATSSFLKGLGALQLSGSPIIINIFVPLALFFYRVMKRKQRKCLSAHWHTLRLAKSI